MAEAIQIKALLSDGPLSPRAALQTIIAVCTAAEAPGVLVPGGRPLSAGSVLLDADGTAQLQEVGEVDSLSVGTLLAQLLLGKMALPASTDALLSALDDALQQPEIAREQRQALVAVVRACHSPVPESRPPLHRLQRRCLDLLPSATGTPLATLLRRRQVPDTRWMDLPDAADAEADDLRQLLSPPSPSPSPSPTPSAATAAATKAASPSSSSSTKARPAPPAEAPPPRSLPLVLGGLGLLLLAVLGGLAVRQWSGGGGGSGSGEEGPGERPLMRAEGILERYGAPDEGRSLTVISLPAGAAVTVDGLELGRTPVEGLTLDVGVHHIQLRGEDKTLFEQAVMVDRDARCTWEPASATGEIWRCEPL